jgi:hypothetical protein
MTPQAGRGLLTLSRWQSMGLHARLPRQAGIVVCSHDPDTLRLAVSIDAAVRGAGTLAESSCG